MKLKSLQKVMLKRYKNKNLLRVLIDWIRKLLGMFKLNADKETIKKWVFLSSVVLLYLNYKKNKRKCKKVFQRNEENLNILNYLQSSIDSFKPTYYLPSAFFQILFGNRLFRYSFNYTEQAIKMEDGGRILLEWYPENYKEMSDNTPIIVFIPGACGSTNENYTLELTAIIKRRNLRLAVCNRRGYGKNLLQSSLFMHREEPLDMVIVTDAIAKEFPSASQYLMGVSAGANHGTLYMGLTESNTKVKAFVSISSPFNTGRISLYMEDHFYPRMFSSLIAYGFKNVCRRHYKNKYFLDLLKKHKLDTSKLIKKLKRKSTCWEVDKFLTSKLSSSKDVYDYYNNYASESVIEDIKVPTLFISNKEDPICRSHFVPFEKIYRNPNTILLLTQRGGHVEYLSGWKMEWWAFETALDYFSYFEKNDVIIK